MDIKTVKALATILKSNDLNVLEVSEGDKKIRLEKSGCCEAVSSKSNISQQTKIEDNSITQTEKPVDFNNIHEVKSPMIGVFYSASSPESEPFVKIGDKVKKGDVLCIIEAMKLMNEICAETEGEIVDICAENEQIIEYGQTLFKIY